LSRYFVIVEQDSIISEKESFWNFYGVKTVSYIGSTPFNTTVVLWNDVASYEPSTTLLFGLCYYLAIASVVTHSLVIILLLLAYFRRRKNTTFDLTPFKFLIVSISIMASVAIVGATCFFFTLPLALGSDKSELIPCTKFQKTCYSFYGAFAISYVSTTWGPSFGWVAAVVASLCSLPAMVMSFCMRTEPLLYIRVPREYRT
jgi:uncharacterized membrane protein